MSAKQAAAALITHDPDIAEKARTIEAMGAYHEGRTEAVMNLLRETMGTWTLTLAAQAANTTEQQVIAAMAFHPSLRIGSSIVTRGIAIELYHPLAKYANARR